MSELSKFTVKLEIEIDLNTQKAYTTINSIATVKPSSCIPGLYSPISKHLILHQERFRFSYPEKISHHSLKTRLNSFIVRKNIDEYNINNSNGNQFAATNNSNILQNLKLFKYIKLA
jgi:hypothetical protein